MEASVSGARDRSKQQDRRKKTRINDRNPFAAVPVISRHSVPRVSFRLPFSVRVLRARLHRAVMARVTQPDSVSRITSNRGRTRGERVIGETGEDAARGGANENLSRVYESRKTDAARGARPTPRRETGKYPSDRFHGGRTFTGMNLPSDDREANFAKNVSAKREIRIATFRCKSGGYRENRARRKGADSQLRIGAPAR